MGDVTLQYRDCDLDELQTGECTIRKCKDGDKLYWRLWFRILDEIGDDAGTLVLLSVPVHARAYQEPDGIRFWALHRADAGRWQVEPSIDAKDIWHHTPLIVGNPPWWPPECG